MAGWLLTPSPLAGPSRISDLSLQPNRLFSSFQRALLFELMDYSPNLLACFQALELSPSPQQMLSPPSIRPHLLHPKATGDSPPCTSSKALPSTPECLLSQSSTPLHKNEVLHPPKEPIHQDPYTIPQGEMGLP